MAIIGILFRDAFITRMYGITPTALSHIPTQCPIQQVNNFIDLDVSYKPKLVMVLVDNSSSYSKLTTSSLDLIVTAIAPEMKPGDRLSISLISSRQADRIIFFDQTVEMVDFPALRATPIPPPLTPTLAVTEDIPSLQKVQIQLTNSAINTTNNTTLQQEYYCQISLWNAEYTQLNEAWLQKQNLAVDGFLDDVKTTIASIKKTQPNAATTHIEESLYFSSRQIQNSALQYSEIILVIFSDMKDTSNDQILDIDLSGVDIIVANQICTNAIECQGISEFWTTKFIKSFRAKSVKFLLVQETNPGTLIMLLNTNH